MKLCEIRNRIEIARKRMEEIKPAIKSYMVVMINHAQFMPIDFTPDSDKLLDLWKYPDVFISGQNIQPLIKDVKEINDLKKRIENLSKKDGKTQENEKKSSEMIAKYHAVIEGLEFHEPTVELRFYDLDMEKIQEIKNHPVVQEVGKTDMSGASIRVVIG